MSKELEAARELVRMLEEREKGNEVALSTLTPGETFKIGKHDFIVLRQDEGQARVISKDFMAAEVVFGDDTRDYNESSLKKLIETEIQPLIEKEVGTENLVEHEVDLTSVDAQNEFATCKCKVRPLIFDEVREYNNLLVNKELDDWWWTCTPWSTKERGWSHSMAVVTPSGYVYDDFFVNLLGVRPFCILKSNIFVSKGE